MSERGAVIIGAVECGALREAGYAGAVTVIGAQDQGTLAARNMLGANEPHAAVPWFWSDQFDLTLQIAGLVDDGRRVVRRDLGADAFLLFHLADDGRLVAASGIGPGNAVARDVRLSEMLIGRRAPPPADMLAAPDTKLKSLVAA